ncbi:hypothetical protein V8E36_007734 [Tilletia maclaganii]
MASPFKNFISLLVFPACVLHLILLNLVRGAGQATSDCYVQRNKIWSVNLRPIKDFGPEIGWRISSYLMPANRRISLTTELRWANSFPELGSNLAKVVLPDDVPSDTIPMRIRHFQNDPTPR